MQEQHHLLYTIPHASPQVIELQIVIKVFELFLGPFNLISDSQYVVNMLQCLEVVGKVNLKSTIGKLVLALQDLILHRSSPFFAQHIRAHTGLPGPLAEGNDIVDKASRACVTFFITSPVALARDFHSCFHVNSKTLSSRFKISHAEVKDIVKMCQKCAKMCPIIASDWGWGQFMWVVPSTPMTNGCYPLSRTWKVKVSSCFHQYSFWSCFCLSICRREGTSCDCTLL